MAPLWIGTNNPKKLAELTRLLAPLGVTLRTPKDLDAEFDPVEDQPDFAGNARKKASLLAELASAVAIADDSGLCVDALDGRPGVLSARYGGPGLDDRGRLLKLLEELQGVPDDARTARFVCVTAVVGLPGPEEPLVGEGRLDGRIAESGTGDHGFGYDPIFFLPERGCTLAELSMAEKNRISHRRRSIEAIAGELLSQAEL